MRYVRARYEQERRDMTYRVYITDLLRQAHFRGRATRFYDLLKPAPEETRTEEELIDYMKNRIAKVGGNG